MLLTFRSFEAWSALNDSLVVDIAYMNGMKVSADRTQATAGAGIRLGALYVGLHKYGVTFHGGICPTVGLGGYVGVGGRSPLDHESCLGAK